MEALKEFLIAEHEFNDANLYYMLYLNNIIIGSNIIGLRNVSEKPAYYCKTYIDKDNIEKGLYTLADNFNSRIIS